MEKIIQLITSFWDDYRSNPYRLISFLLLGVVIGGAAVMKDIYENGVIEQQNHLLDLKACNEFSIKQDSIYKMRYHNTKKLNKKK